jgi:hypothetical protein
MVLPADDLRLFRNGLGVDAVNQKYEIQKDR